MTRAAPKEYYAAMEERIIEHLKVHPVATTEELRVVACDTMEVVWMRLRRLIEAGKLQKGKVKGTVMNKYRLHPEFRKSLESASESPSDPALRTARR